MSLLNFGWFAFINIEIAHRYETKSVLLGLFSSDWPTKTHTFSHTFTEIFINKANFYYWIYCSTFPSRVFQTLRSVIWPEWVCDLGVCVCAYVCVRVRACSYTHAPQSQISIGSCPLGTTCLIWSRDGTVVTVSSVNTVVTHLSLTGHSSTLSHACEMWKG